MPPPWVKRPDPYNPTDQCECGEDKEFNREACPRCLFLDGENRCSRKDSDLIHALRHDLEMQPSTTGEIAAALGRTPDTVRPSLNRLVDAGRLRRFWQDSIHEGPRLGGKFARGGEDAFGCWIYALSAR